jgi:hypothetical protein
MQCPHLEALKDKARRSSASQYPAINVGPNDRDLEIASLLTGASSEREDIVRLVRNIPNEEPNEPQGKSDGANDLLQWRKDQGFALLELVVSHTCYVTTCSKPPRLCRLKMCTIHNSVQRSQHCS